MKKIEKTATIIILLCFICIIVISSFKLWGIFSDYEAGWINSNKAQTVAHANGFDGNINFKKLKKINPDITGWLYLKDSKIDYPVVKANDNDKYLHTMFDGKYGFGGTLFADCNTNIPFYDFNTVIYGHHMYDGSMFNGLKRFKSKEYLDKHNQFELITEDEKYHLDVVAFMNVKSTSDVYSFGVLDPKERQDWISYVKDNALILAADNLDPTDTFVSLSTCAYEFKDARYIVITRLRPWSAAEKGLNPVIKRHSNINPWVLSKAALILANLLVITASLKLLSNPHKNTTSKRKKS